ncbi:sigma-70 family RNA polymerase sigma factor [Candidatus Margulisiibacteriota bacterium]
MIWKVVVFNEKEIINRKAVHGWLRRNNKLFCRVTLISEASALKGYIKLIEKYPLLTKEQEIVLSELIQKGNETAYNALVCCNLRLVIHYARRYTTPRLTLLDFILAGNSGLLQAAQMYRGDKGVRFSYYAQYYINNEMKKLFITTGYISCLKFSQKRYKWVRDLRKAYNEFISLRNYIPSKKELYVFIKHIKMPYDEFKHLYDLIFRWTSFEEGVEKTLQEEDNKIIQEENDIDRLNENDEPLAEYYFNRASRITHQNYEAQESRFLRKEFFELLNNILQTLPEKEELVLRKHYGIDGEKNISLEKIGRQLHVTKERVRQIEKAAFRHLREQKYLYVIKDYFFN